MSGKVKFKNIKEKDKILYFSDLDTVIKLSANKNELRLFVLDILTMSELIMISRRIQIAKELMIDSSYREIKKKLKTSNSTIATVDAWLNYGFGGHKKALTDYFSDNRKNPVKNINSIKSYLRKSHPAHYLVFKLLDKKI